MDRGRVFANITARSNKLSVRAMRSAREFPLGQKCYTKLFCQHWRSSETENNFFIGPNVSYRGDRWFATVTALAQTTRTEGEPDYQVRVIFGFAL